MKILKFGKKTHIVFLTLIFFVSLTYSFVLGNKRYTNFEHGKFDLGNMSQMVWNTSQGRFMEVTDQFGSNMPRWGMSHIDPIIAVFAPVYWIKPHPMLMVLAQQFLVLSAIYPLFVLAKWKSKSVLVGYLIVLAYILYPANGFTLVWTGFHGISFVAPLMVWLVYFLEKYDFLINAGLYKKTLYWFAIIIMLMGKEEIGAILALASIFLYFKNKRLAVYTFIISLSWTLFCFLVFIPSYSHYRSESVSLFFEKVGVSNSESEFIAGENFFLNRYSYLGNSYGEILINTFLKPDLVFKKTFTEDKVNALNNLFGPLGYIVLVSPFWLVSLPDLAVVLLSQDEIFDISNHRIAFMIVSIFLSFVYLFQIARYLANKYFPQFRHLDFLFVAFSLLVLSLNLLFSAKTANPLYVSGKSFIENKLIAKVLAKDYAYGEIRKAQVPRNDNVCLNQMAGIIEEINPEIYTGPDYLGAHAANRRVNALFPSRFWDADLVMADIFEAKTLGAFGDSGWIFNKEGLRRMVGMNRYTHLYSCGKISAFIVGENKDSAVFVSGDDYPQYAVHNVSTEKISVKLQVVEVPENFNKSDPSAFVTVVSRLSGTFKDKVSFWVFEEENNSDNKFMFINYPSVGFPESLDKADENQSVKETFYPRLDILKDGNYKVFWGVGDLLNASEVYIGTVNIRSD